MEEFPYRQKRWRHLAARGLTAHYSVTRCRARETSLLSLRRGGERVYEIVDEIHRNFSIFRVRRSKTNRSSKMSSPSTTNEMYVMRPMVSTTTLFMQEQLMYKMQNFHAEEFACVSQQRVLKDTVDTNKMPDEPNSEVESFKKQVLRLEGKEPLPEYHELEARQSKILNQLADLKKQVSTLCHFLKQSNDATKSNENEIEAATDCAALPQEQVKELTDFQKQVSTLSHFLRQSSENDGVKAATDRVPSTQKSVIEVVMHANPTCPPYATLALQKLWKDVDIRVTSYKHSSTSKPLIQVSPEKNINSALTIIHLSLIWKDTNDLEIVTSHTSTIVGEVNFLRYMSRLINIHNYENIHKEPHLLDTVLDWCYKTRKHLETNGTYDGVEFRPITRHIDEWSNHKEEPNIADIALWSLFKQFPLKNKPQILNEWYDSCVKTFMNINL